MASAMWHHGGMASVEYLASGRVLVVGDERLRDPDNPDDPNRHAFGSARAYYRAVRSPEEWRKRDSFGRVRSVGVPLSELNVVHRR